MITAYQSIYFAHELTKRSSSEKLEKLSQSLLNATVDMNPHQVEAALFAFRSPLSRGALLADEVGLGKTIEAGLVISQLWAERRRRILVIVPTALRKQWNRELVEKFFIPSQILETRLYNLLKKQGRLNPFELRNEIAICSYGFARSKADDISGVAWDLVVVDEAHRLRNVYKKGTKIARSILDSVQTRPKVLLTATPLQNNLMELYGLTQFIDPLIFGDEASFRAQFGRGNDLSEHQFRDLKARLRPVCHRTLRRQVTEYVPYTNRLAITQDFTPTESEQRLYDNISEYLRRDQLQALPTGQRQLMTMVLRKLLASSSFAIAGTLETLVRRLQASLEEQKGQAEPSDVISEIERDVDTLDETKEEWSEDENAPPPTAVSGTVPQLQLLRDEIDELRGYRDLAVSIAENAKGRELLVALKRGFAKLAELGAARKAVIFTESRRTQSYLKRLLEHNGYAGQIVLFNGTNTEPESQKIYKDWYERHREDDQITGSKTADMRSALVEHFRDSASVMIATESGAEGINLQFASLVVNYDLPWNPQRIEQRIGRCHRYGQKHDVVVVNFLNRKNEADVRVFQLLSEKFRLFDGVFGASDEVLGAIESGVDFEKRIANIYQNCRTPEQIKLAFDALQQELNEQITVSLDDTRRKLLEHFDEEVHERLRVNVEKTRAQIGRFEQWLWKLTARELEGHARFNPRQYSFTLESLPGWATDGELRQGRYRLLTKIEDGEPFIHYRPGHPLAEGLINQAKSRRLPPREVIFHYRDYEGKISVIETLIGKSGWLTLTRVAVEALDTEDHLIFSAFTDDSSPVDQETCERLFGVGAGAGEEVQVPAEWEDRLSKLTQAAVSRILGEIGERNSKFFEQEIEKIDKWAEDRKHGLEIELKELDAEIKALVRESRLASDLQTKIDLRRQAGDLEKQRNRKRREIYDAQDEIESSKEALLTEVQARLQQKVTHDLLFTIRWRVA
jgi:superfamily II DNA or RNA helicase